MLRQRPGAIAVLGAATAQLRRDGVRPDDRALTRRRADVRELRGAVSLDHSFMTMMIRHLESAIAMAEREIDRGGQARLVRLAREQKRVYERELAALMRWLRTWYGEDGGDIPDDDGGGGGGSEEPRV